MLSRFGVIPAGMESSADTCSVDTGTTRANEYADSSATATFTAQSDKTNNVKRRFHMIPAPKCPYTKVNVYYCAYKNLRTTVKKSDYP